MAARRVLTLELLVKALAMKYDGKSYEEIAETLGCSRSTVTRWVPRLENILKENYALLRIGGGTVKVKTPSKDYREENVVREVHNTLKELKEVVARLEREVREIKERLPKKTESL